VAELSKFSTNPVAVHYSTLKRIFCYMCQTKHYCLLYWQPAPRNDLPNFPFADLCPLDELDCTMSTHSAKDELCSYLDAAHANCLRTRRYVGPQVFCLTVTAIAYRAKWIMDVCLISTECEFMMTVGAAEVAKFLDAILIELGILQLLATTLYEDNAASKIMANASRLTD
jgi:hypothetical protein